MALVTETQNITPTMQNLWSLAGCKGAQSSFCFQESLKEQMFADGSQQRLCCLKIPSVIYEIFNMKFQEAQWILSRPLTKGQLVRTSPPQASWVQAGSPVSVRWVFVFVSYQIRRERAISGERIICAFFLWFLILLATNCASPTLQFAQSLSQRHKN